MEGGCGGLGQVAASEGDKRELVFWKGLQRKQQQTPKQNTSGSTESRVSCSKVWGHSRKKLSQPKRMYALCSRTPCRLSRKHLPATQICPYFFQNWRKQPHPDKINHGGRGGIILANISLLLHPCPVLRAREIPLA